MQTMLPTLEQHAASAAQLDEEDARRLARWAEVVPWSWETFSGGCNIIHSSTILYSMLPYSTSYIIIYIENDICGLCCFKLL
jgi:hypothetical protein